MGTDWLDMHDRDRVPSWAESERRAADTSEAWRDRVGGWVLVGWLLVAAVLLVLAFNALGGEQS